MKVNLSWLRATFWLVGSMVYPLVSGAQDENKMESATLEEVVAYALKHQPGVQQAEINQEIVNQAVKGKLADWYPQISFNYNYQRFIDLQSSVIGGEVIRFGVNNTSSAQLTATQSLFNRDVLLASNTASTVRLQAEQGTQQAKIQMVVNVSKAFYDLLATQKQIEVSEESVIRLESSLKDARSRYEAGVADKTDYQRATIALGNAQAAYKANQELLGYKQQNLKTLMGYPLEEELPIAYDVDMMENEILLDTSEQMNPVNHINFRLLQTQRELQEANVKYNQWAFLPSLSAFGAYNLNYQNDNFGELYNTSYPYSYVGATLSLPLFQGGKRLSKIQEQKWTSDRLDVGIADLKNKLDTEYDRALAAYKSNLYSYLAQKKNVELAQEVYDIIQLQYQSGVKTYLDVTIAETDLRTTRINYFNALYQVLASKIDVNRALGTINY
ncbi:TolC family protein [Marinoscillum sp. 108]|uniref:TolC family protein n=1 Tax=Marinoscillum sp. 108 TaxID=2653151 RepID=UPI0012F0CBF9|nr:TolC family protein [Marinoscillum sp. 108]VXD18628.1 Outer membrane protein TolC [Marinoscillum sp. 108]